MSDETEDKKQRIADLPKHRDLATAASVVSFISKWSPRIAPIARVLGFDLSRWQPSKEIAELGPKVDELVQLPDRFNSIYSRLGWIAYSSFSVPLMQDAVAAADAGDLARGESLLVDYFTKDQLDFHITRMSSLRNFRERVPLTHLVRDDFLEGRFHSCVPNLLMLIDGLATDAAESNESFFSDRAILSAWDSIEGHATGLPTLAKLMSLSRQKLRTDPISIPYRHGILHGRDLGFATKLVAAKCWGALFALGDWARLVENGLKERPPSEPQKSLRESLDAFAKQQESTRRWTEWRPRNVVVGRDIPNSGLPEDYAAETPERALTQFMHFWSKRNYGDMAKLVSIGWNKVDPRTRAKDIKRTYREFELGEFQLRGLEDRGPMACEVTIVCNIVGFGEHELSYVLVYEDEQGDWLKTEWDQGTWRIQNWGVVGAITPIGEQLEP